MFIFLWIIIVLLVLSLLFLYLIKPNKKRDTSYFENKMYAHRGLHDEEVSENSLTAFKKAKEAGFGVELDVQLTKDDVLVVFHDGNLKRMCGIDGELKNYTYEELCQYRLKNTGDKIPTFKEVLSLLEDMDLICEIKGNNGNANYHICERTYEEIKDYKGKYMIESFSPLLIAWFKTHHPEIIRGQLSSGFRTNKEEGPLINFCMRHLLFNVFSRPDFIAYKHADYKEFGLSVVRKLYKPFLVAWTARGPVELESAKKNFDAVIFEKNAREVEE